MENIFEQLSQALRPDNQFTPATAAFNFLASRMPSNFCYDPMKWEATLKRYWKEVGDEAMEGLAGFYLYAIRKIKGEKGTQAIKETFAHDLQASNDPQRQPKSISYASMWRNEAGNHFKF